MPAKFEFLKNIFVPNQVPVVQKLPVAGSQTLVVGDLVFLSSGLVTKAGASTSSVLGLMMEDSSSATASTLVKVALAAPGHVYKAVADADPSSIVLTNKTVDINATTQTVDVADTTNGCIIILEEDPDVTNGVHVMFTAFDLGAA